MASCRATLAAYLLASAVSLSSTSTASANYGNQSYQNWYGYYWNYGTVAVPAVHKKRLRRYHVNKYRHHRHVHDKHVGDDRIHRRHRSRNHHVDSKLAERMPKATAVHSKVKHVGVHGRYSSVDKSERVAKRSGRARLGTDSNNRVARGISKTDIQKKSANAVDRTNKIIEKLTGATQSGGGAKAILSQKPIDSERRRPTLSSWPDMQLVRAISLTEDDTAIFEPTYSIHVHSVISRLIAPFRQYFEFLIHNANAPLDHLAKSVRDKLEEISHACQGLKVISTVCGSGGHSHFVRGTHRVSLHCTNEAADFWVPKWSCASPFLTLARWKGGANRDPEVVNHYHISAPRTREAGHRFCHHGQHRDGSCVGSGSTQVAHHHRAKRIRVAHLSAIHKVR